MKIYTRTGDAGETALFGGERVGKDHPRVEAYGTVDEVNALLGRALPDLIDPDSRERLARIQHDLFGLGSHLATPPPRPGRPKPRLPPLPEDTVAAMERWMDEAEAELEPLRNFILPGGTAGAAALHHARTVCRRAERAVVALGSGDGEEGLDPFVVIYLNRLSDLLFVLARIENHRAGLPDVVWSPGKHGLESE